MKFQVEVKSVVEKEDEDGTTWKVNLKGAKGERIQLPFGSEAETHGYSPGTIVIIVVENPQRTL